jgi:hypothetical protein
MMAFLTATINVLSIDQLVQMVANLNHNRYIDTFPDGRLEQRAANLTAAIQMYERGGDPCPRVNQLQRENVRLRDVNQMLNNKYGIFEHTYMVVPDPEQGPQAPGPGPLFGLFVSRHTVVRGFFFFWLRGLRLGIQIPESDKQYKTRM